MKKNSKMILAAVGTAVMAAGMLARLLIPRKQRKRRKQRLLLI